MGQGLQGELPQQQTEAVLANPLTVPYDSQHDNPSGEGWRECFSSSCAMVAKFWLPELDMNDYLRRRPAYGDSTDASAQIRCLESFGLSARFVQVGSIEKLKAQLDRGQPAPVGFLHHGHFTAPTGGGHYAVAIGYTDESVIMNDPNGHLDPIEGGYLNNSCRGVFTTCGISGPHAGRWPMTTTAGAWTSGSLSQPSSGHASACLQQRQACSAARGFASCSAPSGCGLRRSGIALMVTTDQRTHLAADPRASP